MSLKKTIGKFLPIVDGDERKERIAKKVLKLHQQNNDIVNIHRYDMNNVGDYYCAPHLYFKELNGKYLDISDIRSLKKEVTKNWIKQVSNNSLIIGGGGLLNIKYFDRQMKLFEELGARGKKTVIWGAGHNETDRSQFGKVKNYNVDLKKFGLVGTRDYSMDTEWIPCVSCLHSIFDNSYKETQDIGILYSKKTIKNNKNLVNRLSDFPFTSNTTNLKDMISFIGKSNTLVTDSYHAMYWAILLGKKTLVVPTTSKFYDFKYKSVITTFENFTNDLPKAQSYSGVLEESRELNIKFAEKVFDYLNL
ncbi:polysaccharide pyruvyl transferase family protein [Winogradskyella alexanderae]|uniref:Polysaccharide pyruvyl transferase family protein n=1 Tax=Winogradskyella alexanderae TaxID=2877123 RepID=A0ABS7XQ00_9FLAO|nr:polysaccharide pyruvyl transferase family protein [Winogradskyella alexanderae]MCA0132093.1 polysaccharide pyruvyl transferase family protein [Winogradskyella alexanderae]